MVSSKLTRTAVLVIAVLCAWGPLSAWATLRAFVDRNPVAEDESFTLTLESNSDINASPDLSSLRQDFDVQGQGKSSSIIIDNGAMTRKTQWQISLMAKHGGQLLIPPITVGSEQSQSLTVTILPTNQVQAAPGEGDLFLDVSANPKIVYAQQQVIYTVRLYRAVNLADGSSLSEPVLPNGEATVEKLGNDKNYETLRNGVRYDVIERRYAIYPQKSGSIDIAPLVFDGNLVQGGGGGLFALDPFNQRVRHKRLRSRGEHIDVKPMPVIAHGSQWLPARSLELKENWSPEPPQFTVGQAVTRTISIVADGLTASQLPVLTNVVINGLKQYPDQPALKDTQNDTGIIGQRTDKIAYIPVQTGDFTLPAVKIMWWNTGTDKVETASLPPRTFTVRSAPAGSYVTATPVPQASAPTVKNQNVPAAVTIYPAPLALSPTSPVSGRWPWIALLLGLGWLATLAVWWWRARRNSMSIAPTHSEEEESLRRLEKSVQTGCLANDAVRAKSAILAWARRRWPEHPPISLIAVARRCPDTLSAALIELDREVYAQAPASWQGQVLWQQFAANKVMSRKKGKDQVADLEPLYRNS